MATAAARPQPVDIPNKLYFRIGDVSRLTGIKAYVLRYWETEFGALSPKKSGTNQRLYRRKDVEMVLEIKHLLYEKRYTIEGARTFLQHRKSHPRTAPTTQTPAPAPTQSSLFGPDPGAVAAKANERMSSVRTELRSILDLLS
jgi:DNA-binding transcriptional MerR regulator